MPVAKQIKVSPSEKRRRIDAAALALFTTQGFHGTNNREIAKRAGVSAAAIYTHYASKEAIFDELIETHRRLVGDWLRKTVSALKDPLSKHDLTALASAICTKMHDDPEYFQLIFIDVVEFESRRSQAFFHDVPKWFQHLLGPLLDKVKEQPDWCGQDPAFVMAAIYMYFIHYGLIEQHMGGRQHMGVPSEVAIERVIDLLSGGLWRLPPNAVPGSHPDRARHSAADRKRLDEAADDRIDFIRLLSCRMWNAPPEIPGRQGRPQAGHPTPKTPLMVLPQIARQQPDDTQLRIEAAALELFTTQGFHGTNMRDIARKADVALGAIYTYYASKEILFEQLVAIYRGCVMAFLRYVVMMVEDPFSLDGLRLLAKSIRSIVYDDAQYWLLLFIDILEFENRHFVDIYHDMPAWLGHFARPYFEKTKQQPGWCGLDPAFAFATIYLLFFAHFIVERHMQGDRHLGVSEDEAIERLIDLVSSGFWRRPPLPASPMVSPRRRSARPA